MTRRLGKRMKRLLLVAVSVAVLMVAGATGALAGEVKGPPNQIDNTNTTGALEHANSPCAASGLNDFDPTEGQNVSQVQTAADSWKYYGLPKGAPGTLGLCRGGAEE
jgi:opacity protein-like surface antigen